MTWFISFTLISTHQFLKRHLIPSGKCMILLKADKLRALRSPCLICFTVHCKDNSVLTEEQGMLPWNLFLCTFRAKRPKADGPLQELENSKKYKQLSNWRTKAAAAPFQRVAWMPISSSEETRSSSGSSTKLKLILPKKLPHVFLLYASPPESIKAQKAALNRMKLLYHWANNSTSSVTHGSAPTSSLERSV